MTDTWQIQFRAKDFSAGTQFLTKRLWRRLPQRWVLSALGGAYSLLFTLGIFSLWRVVEDSHIPHGRWFVGIFGTVFLLGVLATGASRRIWSNGVQRLWGSNDSPDFVCLDAAGISIEGGMGFVRIPWSLVQEIVREREYLYVIYRNVACLYIPDHGFSASAEAMQFEAKARELFEKAQSASSE